MSQFQLLEKPQNSAERSERLPCRGCTKDCKRYLTCDGKPWRLGTESLEKKALLIVAHGSRLASSNEEVVDLVGVLAPAMGDEFDIIQCAFLEFASPSIPEGINLCLQQGATSVTLLPYFLSAGKHVRVDIPEAAEATCGALGLPLTILPHIGASHEMVPLLQNVAIAS